jgi:hypothetical protein
VCADVLPASLLSKRFYLQADSLPELPGALKGRVTAKQHKHLFNGDQPADTLSA